VPSGEKEEIIWWASAKEGWSMDEVDWGRPLGPFGYKLETFFEEAISNLSAEFFLQKRSNHMIGDHDQSKQYCPQLSSAWIHEPLTFETTRSPLRTNTPSFSFVRSPNQKQL